MGKIETSASMEGTEEEVSATSVLEMVERFVQLGLAGSLGVK